MPAPTCVCSAELVAVRSHAAILAGMCMSHQISGRRWTSRCAPTVAPKIQKEVEAAVRDDGARDRSVPGSAAAAVGRG